MSKNIKIDSADFARRLQSLREERGLTRAELAQKAELTYRTILNLESCKLNRIQEKTLLLLLEALQIERAALLAPDSGTAPDASEERLSSPGLRRAIWIAPLAIVAILLIGLVWRPPSTFMAIRSHEKVLEGWVAGAFPRWSLSPEGPISQVERFKSSDGEVVLYTSSRNGSADPKIQAASVSTGELKWDYRPDYERLGEIFGPDYAGSNAYDFKRIFRGNLSRGEEEEAIAYLQHEKWFPSAIVILDPASGELDTFYHWGHLYEFHVEDVDGDDRQELFIGGTNNTQEYRGATLLAFGVGDEGRSFGGSTEESGSDGTNWSWRRIVFPEFAPRIMELNSKHSRINVFDIVAQRDPQGGSGYLVNVGTLEFFVTVSLDENLEPFQLTLPDQALSRMRQWPKGDQEVYDLEYFHSWLRTYHVFDDVDNVAVKERDSTSGTVSKR